MLQDKIYAELNEVFREVFESDDVNVGPDTTADDIDEWDSLRHINLLIAIESHFGIKFTSSEVEKLTRVGDIERIVAVRISA